MKWRCTVCGYIHEGDAPPEICPVCGVDSSFFEKVEDVTDIKAEVKAEVKDVKKEESPLKELSPEEAMIKAVRSLSYGLFIISANYEGKDNAQTANTCFQITADPVQLAIGINKNNYTHELISESNKFGVSILDQNGHDLARTFGYKSGRDVDKFEGIKVHRGQSGVLLPNEVLGTLEAEVVDKMDAGTHTIFLGKVIAGEFFGNGEPMTYSYFRSKKK